MNQTHVGGFLLQVGHTSEFNRSVLTEARELLDTVFAGEMTDDDWEHALGGMHTVVWQGESIVGHASVVQRRLIHGERSLRTGYVEGVGVHPAQQRQGIGGHMMSALEQIIDAAYDIGALGASDDAITLYSNRGWIRWQGAASAMTPAGIVRTPDEEGWIFVWPAGQVMDMTGELTCDWRDGDVW